MPTVLITGANRGIGLEFSRQYAEAGWRVVATCRDPSGSSALTALAGAMGTISVQALDVTDSRAMAIVARSLADGPLDLLINNAGVYGNEGGSQEFGHLDEEAWVRVFRVNTIAAVKMAEAFIGHLGRGHRPVIANLSSKMGSIADNGSGGTYLYRASKAALNAATKSMAVDLARRGIIAIVLHPGWVKTDMGGPGALISVETSVRGMREVIDRLTPADSGRFIDRTGVDVPW